MCPKDNDKMDRESLRQTEMKIFEKIKKTGILKANKVQKVAKNVKKKS